MGSNRWGRPARVLVAAGLVVGVSGVAVLVPPASPAGAFVPSGPNPTIPDQCGLDVTLVLDASGSVNSSGAVEDVRNAAQAFVETLADTDSRARITQFASLSAELAPQTEITQAAVEPGGVLADAVNAYYPGPPRPSGVNLYQYDGSGDALSSGNYRNINSSSSATIWTNWDQGLDQAGTGVQPGDLVVFITDGRPTAFDFNQPGDPFDAGPPPDVAIANSGNPSGSFATQALDRAVLEANDIKQAGARILTVGVGTALDNSADRDRLVAISGDKVVTDSSIGSVNSINDIDVALVRNFNQLENALRNILLQLCSPSLTITKLAQTPGSAAYTPAQGWDITVTPRVLPPGTSFRWILPDTTPAASKTVATQANGTAQFQWEPEPPEANSAARVQETLQAGYVPGRPGVGSSPGRPEPEDDFTCEARDAAGNVRVVTGELGADGSFDLNPIRQEIVACTIYNSFDYQPAIALTKVDEPTSVRGDLEDADGGPAVITSTFRVTNPGNTPLSAVEVTDDKCAVPSTPDSGDTNDNDKLDPGEEWVFSCTREIVTPASTDPAGQDSPNEAVARGTPPTGPTVESPPATAVVTAYNPAISVDKLVEGVDGPVTVPSGSDVTYDYRVTNEGNTPLAFVRPGDGLVDDTPPCTSPTRGPDSPGNGDDVLDVGETWTFTCDSPGITSSVVNTATVTATPLNPQAPDPTDEDGGWPPYPSRTETPNPPNPVVTATDTAEVDVVNPDIEITKTADPPVILLDENGTPEPVDYTFAVTNNGDEPLTRPADNPGSTKDPGWVGDNRCSPVTFVDGDTNGNDVLDPGETWNFECGPVPTNAPVINVATIVGQGVDTGARVVDIAAARVDVLRPGIDVIKTALRGVVLDPDADAESGPDTPTPRPAEYRYEVFNTGNVPLDLQPDPPTDDKCAGPLVFDTGDTNNDGLLDVGEIWVYTCETLLGREDGFPAPPQVISSLVTNEVTVTGVPQGPDGPAPDKSVTATDIAQVLVIEPGLEITKTASADIVLVNDEVTYTFDVTNTGDVGLDITTPQDDRCSPLVFQGGDDGNGILDGANSDNPETWRYTCTRTLGLPAPPDLTDVNTVRVSGTDPLGNRYVDTDTAEVRVFDPAIDLVKTVNYELVPVGTVVTYDFLVTNAGDSPIPEDDVLANVNLVDASDPAQPSCASPTFIGGDVVNPGFLDRNPAETWRYRCTAPIDQPTTNVAVVGAVGGTGPRFDPDIPVPVFDFDTAFVQPFDPGIEVVKSAEPTELLGAGEVTYTYEVTNTGNVPLQVGKNPGDPNLPTDDTCGPLVFVSGDGDDDGLLDTPNSIFEDAAEETWVFTCTTTVSETTTNVVTAPGTPTDPGGTPLCGPQAGPGRVPEPCDVTDTDTETVPVIEPATIVVEKETDPPGETGFDFAFAAGGGPPQPFTLDDGESETFTPLRPGEYTVTELVPSGFELARVACEVTVGNDVSTIVVSDATATIDLAEGETVTCTYTNVELAGIVIEKETLPDGSTQPFEFTSPTLTPSPFSLADGDFETFSELTPGTYEVAETALDGWALADLVCDDTDNTTVDLQNRTVSIGLDAGELVTCTFTNVELGDIVISKVTAPVDSEQPFGFTENDPTGFTLRGGESLTRAGLLPTGFLGGPVYQFTEDVPAGWELVDLECVDPTGNTTVDLDTASAQVTLDPGETVECTYTNLQLAGIIVEKVTDPPDATAVFDFSVPPLGSFPLQGGESRLLGDLEPDLYPITETPPPGWALTELDCEILVETGEPSLIREVLEELRAEIELSPGEVVRCTFTNTELGSITIEKETVAPGSTESFGFTSTELGPFQLTGASPNDTTTFPDLLPGEYTVAESSLPPGWRLTDLTCTGADGSTVDVDLGNGTVDIDLAAGEDITCTFENTELGTIAIEKVTDPPDDPTVFPFTSPELGSFGVPGGGRQDFLDLLPGEYSVTETVPDSWQLDELTCTDSTAVIDLEAGTAELTLDPGEDITCTYTDTRQAVLIVAKQTVPDDSDQVFDFGVTGPSTDESFGLTDDGSRVIEFLSPGGYTVTETVPGGWAITDIDCTDETAITDFGAGTAEITLEAAEVVTCTYENTELGTIEVTKVTDPPGSPQQFEFTTDFPVVGSDTTLGDGETFASEGLLPGDYSVSEVVPDGWALTDLVCTDASGGTQVDVAGGTASVGLAAGENVSCTFSNTELSTIVVEKVASPASSSQLFDFDFAPPLGDPTAFQLAAGDSQTFDGLLPGEYTVTETVPGGWQLTNLVCDAEATTDPATGDAVIDLPAGETVTCTYTNVQSSGIVIEKETLPDGSTQPFDFTLVEPTGGTTPFQLADGQSEAFGGLLPGEYTVTETVPGGWDLTGLVCVDPSGNTTVDVGEGVSTIVLDAGEIITCTYTNTQRATIVVAKETDPAGSPQDFGFTLTGQPGFTLADGDSETVTGLVPGTYTVAEAVPTGWQLTGLVCTDPTGGTTTALGSASASIRLDPGDRVTCTYTNTQLGSVTIVKRTDPADSAQQFDFAFDGSAFRLGNGGTRTFSGLLPGTYAASETLPERWLQVSAVCDDGSSPGSIRLTAGESVVCTFTNRLPTVVPQPPIPELPDTGVSSVERLVWLGSVILLLGATALGLTRRRTPTT